MHQAAPVRHEQLITEHWRLFTTNFILAETHALLTSRLNSQIALRALHEIDRSATTIVRVTVEDERQARAVLATYADKTFSLTDALSFVVMARVGITTAFTFDRHFAQYGLSTLPSSLS